MNVSHLNTKGVDLFNAFVSKLFMLIVMQCHVWCITGSDVLKCPITCEVFKDPVVAAGTYVWV